MGNGSRRELCAQAGRSQGRAQRGGTGCVAGGTATAVLEVTTFSSSTQQQLIYARPAYGTGRVTRWTVSSYNPHESLTRQEGDRVPSLPCRGVPELAAWRINTSLRSHTCLMHPDDTHLPTLLGPVRGTWGFTAGKTSKFLLGTTRNSNPSHSKGNHQHDGKATYRTGGNTCKSFI